MIRVTVYFYLLFLTVFIQNAGAQQLHSNGLEDALKSGDRQETGLQFYAMCKAMTGRKDDEKPLLHLLNIAHELSRAGKADLVWPGLLRLAGNPGEKICSSDSVRFKLLSELGAAFFYDNRFQRADSVFKSTLSFFDLKDRNENPDFAFTCNFLGLTAMWLGKPDSSLLWFEKARLARIRIYGENHSQVAGIYNNLGLLCKNTGDYAGAIRNYQKAIGIKRKTNDRSVFLNLINLGELYGMRGQYSSALDLYRQADSIISREKPNAKHADLYMNSGAMMYYLQRYEEALDYFRKALRIYTSLTGESSVQSGKVYQNMANVYNGLGNREEEQKAIEKALAILEHELSPEHPDLAPLFNNLGMIFQNRKQFRKSIDQLMKAKDIYLSQPEDQPEKSANTLINMAATFQLAGMPDSAIDTYRQAIVKLEKHTGGKHPYLSYAYNALAEIFLNSAHFHQADSLADKAIEANFRNGSKNPEIPDSCFNPGYLFESLILKGNIYWKSDTESADLAENAFRFFRKADTLLSLQRNSLFNEADKITFSKNARALAESSLECLCLHKTAGQSPELLSDGFRFAEKSRNIVMLQTLREEEARHLSGFPDSILVREEELRGNINALIHGIETGKGKFNTEDLEEQLFTNRREYKYLMEIMEKEYPWYQEMKYSDSVPSLADLQTGLENGTALLAYFTGDSVVFRFTVLKNHFSLDRSTPVDLEDLLTGYRKGITLRLDDVYREKATRLYHVLFPSPLPGNVRKLTVIPDGILSAVPFEALLYERPDDRVKYSEYPFLVNRFEISYSPSLAIRDKLKKSSDLTGLPSSLLAFAPVFDKTGNKSSAIMNHLPETYPENKLYLEYLPSTRNEILRIDSLFRSMGKSTEIRLSEQATEGNFLTSDLRKSGYLHIATHGSVNDNNPGLSGLYFHPANNPESDNVLHLGEIYHLRLNARLVTLSACETGLGKLAAGEGILGFSRAFLLAGARNLLLSLWKVNDTSTTELMTQFYKFHLENEIPLAESLRNAKLSLIRNPDTNHPYFWAPFLLTGD